MSRATQLHIFALYCFSLSPKKPEKEAKKEIPLLPLLSTILLAILLGYLLGRLTTLRFSLPETEISLVDDTRPGIPIVRIEGIRDGLIRGSIQGKARLFLGEEYIIPNESGAIAIEPDIFLEDIVTVLIPEGMNFVASKRGKKFYPVFSSQGERIVPKNRLYFKTEGEAENAGYVR